MFLPVLGVVDLHTKVFCFLDCFELIVTNFQIQILNLTSEDIVLLLGLVETSMGLVFATFKESLLP